MGILGCITWNFNNCCNDIFSKLYKKYLDIKQEYIHNTDICMLSMGMTHDFEIALQEGANIIRVGTGIFH